MTETATLTLNLPAETKDKLDRLADATNRDRAALGAEAISDYVARELAIVEAIEDGRRDVREGRIVPHDDVLAEARARIEAARRGR